MCLYSVFTNQAKPMSLSRAEPRWIITDTSPLPRKEAGLGDPSAVMGAQWPVWGEHCFFSLHRSRLTLGYQLLSLDALPRRGWGWKPEKLGLLPRLLGHHCHFSMRFQKHLKETSHSLAAVRAHGFQGRNLGRSKGRIFSLPVVWRIHSKWKWAYSFETQSHKGAV